MWTRNNNLQELEIAVIMHGPDILKNCETSHDLSQYLDRLASECLNYPVPPKSVDTTEWLIPREYQEMDIEGFLVNVCPKQNYNRLIKELELYRENDMLPLLRTMKYIVDILEKNNIVWGVGRGSSVASYVLYLIGVHMIDSVKYNLPIEEFFKGEK
jgi:DNA polymerase III alpha subunit